MKDVFEVIDNWNTKFNVLGNQAYMRKVVLYFSVAMIPVWAILGFDSGVGMLEIWNNNWQLDYSAYGKTFHFSAFVIYGFLFCGLSKHFENIGLKKSRNIFSSACLVVLNISIFELVYMASFAHYQMNRNLFEWLISDFWFLRLYFQFLVVGLIGLLIFVSEGYIIQNRETVGRRYRLELDKKILAPFCVVALLWLTWIYYPFPTQTAFIKDWMSSELFPQTHYAYVGSEIYIRNDLLHLLNVTVKAMFAYTQFYTLTKFRKVTQHG